MPCNNFAGVETLAVYADLLVELRGFELLTTLLCCVRVSVLTARNSVVFAQQRVRRGTSIGAKNCAPTVRKDWISVAKRA